MAGLRWFIYQTSEETISERDCAGVLASHYCR